MPTNVPSPAYGPNGFVPPDESAVLAGLLADINAAYGVALEPNLATPQGQLASSLAAIIGDANALFLWFVNNSDPAYASGRMQDALGRIYFISRIPGSPTVVEATCSGLDGVVIPVGALAQADDGNLYVCTQQGTIANGSVILPFACQANGPIPCPGSATIGGSGALATIYQTIFGWDSVSNVNDGVLGRLVETPSQFEARRAASVGWQSTGPLGAVLGGVLSVAGVLDAYVTENYTDAPLTVGGIILGPNSLYACVLGGNANDVASAIWTRKMPGCGYNGNTTILVTDPNPAYSPPAPVYPVTYQTPQIVDFVANVVLANNSGVPANAGALIQAAIVLAFAGGDGGPRAKIGSTMLASRYYAPVALLGSWAQIVDIQIGQQGSGASILGQISGTTLTVTGIVNGSLAVGQLLSGSGLTSGTGTLISGLLSGTGGIGTYRLSYGQSVANGAMFATNLVNSTTLNINQAPAIAPSNVFVELQ